jgi:hypothetical protein
VGPRGVLKGDVNEGKASCSNIDDLYYLELVVESIIPLNESSNMRRYTTTTLMILSMCATYIASQTCPFHVHALSQHFNNMCKLKI